MSDQRPWAGSLQHRGTDPLSLQGHRSQVGPSQAWAPAHLSSSWAPTSWGELPPSCALCAPTARGPGQLGERLPHSELAPGGEPTLQAGAHSDAEAAENWPPTLLVSGEPHYAPTARLWCWGLCPGTLLRTPTGRDGRMRGTWCRASALWPLILTSVTCATAQGSWGREAARKGGAWVGRGSINDLGRLPTPVCNAPPWGP